MSQPVAKRPLFLSLMRFWQALRGRIEQHARPDEAEGATDAATAVFAHFLALAEKAQTAEAVA